MKSKNISKPAFSAAAAARLAESAYGLNGSWKPLPSERDQNFHLTTADGPAYTLKITGLTEAIPILDMQNKAMAHVNRTFKGSGLTPPCPELLKAGSGQMIESIKNDKGTNYPVRLLTYLPGTLYGDTQPQAAALQQSVGTFLGRLDEALRTFVHPAAQRFLQWDLTQAGFINDYTQFITNETDRAVVLSFLNTFQQQTLPRLPSLRCQIIHNDANDYNLLVDTAAGGNSIVTAIIDFGDMLYAPTICEVAIGAAYALLGQPDPVLAAAQVIAGYHAYTPLFAAEIDLLFNLIAMRLCVSVTVAAANQQQEPDNAYLQISARPAWEALHRLAACEAAAADGIFRYACGLGSQTVIGPTGSGKATPPAPEATLTNSQILDLRQKRIGPSLSISYDKPLKIVRGSMQYLYDENGRAYLDAVNNVPHVGHCHPHVVQAGQLQMALLNTNTRYLHDYLVAYADRLAAKFPDPLNVVYFVCSGSEANELAVRLARTYTKRHDMLVLDAAYHGNTGELVNLSPYKFNGRGGQGAPDYVHVLPMPDPYRGPYKGYGPATGHRYAQQVKTMIDQLKVQGRPPAAFIEESLLGCGGQIVLPAGYLAQAFAQVRAAGGLCIADEVQIGFGRVGNHFWGFETQAVVPDIVTLGKPMGNGHPLAAVVTTPEIAAAFANGMEYFNTFGGNPVSCAIGMAVLDVIEQENLQQNALVVGDYLRERLAELQVEHELLGDVRGRGLYLGIECVRDRETLEPAAREASKIVNMMKERGILISTDGPLHNVLKIKPPLIFSEENADFLVDTLAEILSQI